jgi:hypothetical protein
MVEHEDVMRKWNENGEEILNSAPDHHVVVWYHDESIFYAHDHQQLCWVHSSESAKPFPKGKGASFMVADFISADYGWLRGDG